MAQTKFDQAEEEQIYQDFKQAVNMTATQLQKWLQTPESKEVGFRHEGESESVGHESGQKIVDILHKKKAELNEPDFAHMRKVVGYVKRHLAQRPAGDISDTRWRYSLMNWGHEPQKD